MKKVEVIEAEDLQEIKSKLYEIEEKVCKSTASDDEIEFLIDLIQNTVDYSNLLKIPDQPDHEFQAKSDFQTLGLTIKELIEVKTDENKESMVKNTIALSNDISKLTNIHIRVGKYGLKIRLLAAKRKPFKDQLDSFFDLLNKSQKANETYAKKWLKPKPMRNE